MFYVFDERGNAVLRLNKYSGVLSQHKYQAYGKEITTRTAASGAASDPWGFGAQYGYYTDSETGFVYCTFRYYDPTIGRWLSHDPIGLGGGQQNLYAYCGGDPVNRIDPSGLWVEMSFDRKNGKLFVWDHDTNEKLFLSGVFSGKPGYRDASYEWDSNRGPIPAGMYLVGSGYYRQPGQNKMYWFPLYGKYEPNHFTHYKLPKPNGYPWEQRGGFMLHAGRGSAGCITVTAKGGPGMNMSNPIYPISPDFDNIAKMLNTTSPVNMSKLGWGVNKRATDPDKNVVGWPIKGVVFVKN